MTVLLTGRRLIPTDAFREILDSFCSDIDWTRGVFLKPNIVSPSKPDSGDITPPALIAAFIGVLRRRHHSVDIVMGDGVAAGRDAAENFHVSGFARLSRELDVPLLDLHNVERRTVPWKFGELSVPSVALDRIYVNLPILKHSSACVISGALKNQKGLLLPEMKKQFHRLGLHEQIAELNAAVRPSLTLLDSSRFFGPNVLISGSSCGEVDATACRLLGIPEPDHVRLARLAGVFGGEFSVQGDLTGIKPIARRPRARETKRFGRMRLWSNAQACTGCRALLGDATRDVLRPGELRAKWKLLSCSARGAEIVMGSNPRWRRDHETVICIGSCTRRLARENGYLHVPGCPPALRDLYDALSITGAGAPGTDVDGSGDD